MKIAIPLFNERVSPRFDVAPRLLLATVKDRVIVAQEELTLRGYDVFQRSALLKDLGVDILICGGIQCFIRKDLCHSNVQVLSPVAGDAETALSVFLQGRLSPPTAPPFTNQECRGSTGSRPRQKKTTKEKEK